MKTGLLVGAAVAALLIGGPPAQAGEPIVRLELNALEASGPRCRLSFVIENRGETPVETLKLDLAVFGREGNIQRRLIAEMGPLRRSKTIVRTFETESSCNDIASVLVNDVAACAPAALGDCLDQLALSSRTPIRLFR